MLLRVSVLAAALLAPDATRAEDSAEAFRQLLIQYRCPVVDRLEQIYERLDTTNPQNWFLIISFAARPHDYVQCVFDTRIRMLCEAASGFYDNVATEPRARRLPASTIAALGRLGFSTDDSAGNFQVWLDVADPPDLNTMADFILKALHVGFDARSIDTLEFNAPVAPHATTKCVPVS
jgi:hypothetical protein